MSPKPDAPRRTWLLLLAALVALGAGAAYFWQLRQGLGGVDLLGYFTVWLAVPLAASLLLIFAYFRPAAPPRP